MAAGFVLAEESGIEGGIEGVAAGNQEEWSMDARAFGLMCLGLLFALGCDDEATAPRPKAKPRARREASPKPRSRSLNLRALSSQLQRFRALSKRARAQREGLVRQRAGRWSWWLPEQRCRTNSNKDHLRWLPAVGLARHRSPRLRLHLLLCTKDGSLTTLREWKLGHNDQSFSRFASREGIWKQSRGRWHAIELRLLDGTFSSLRGFSHRLWRFLVKAPNPDAPIKLRLKASNSEQVFGISNATHRQLRKLWQLYNTHRALAAFPKKWKRELGGD